MHLKMLPANGVHFILASLWKQKEVHMLQGKEKSIKSHFGYNVTTTSFLHGSKFLYIWEEKIE